MNIHRSEKDINKTSQYFFNFDLFSGGRGEEIHYSHYGTFSNGDSEISAYQFRYSNSVTDFWILGAHDSKEVNVKLGATFKVKFFSCTFPLILISGRCILSRVD